MEILFRIFIAVFIFHFTESRSLQNECLSLDHVPYGGYLTTRDDAGNAVIVFTKAYQLHDIINQPGRTYFVYCGPANVNPFAQSVQQITCQSSLTWDQPVMACCPKADCNGRGDCFANEKAALQCNCYARFRGRFCEKNIDETFEDNKAYCPPVVELPKWGGAYYAINSISANPPPGKGNKWLTSSSDLMEKHEVGTNLYLYCQGLFFAAFQCRSILRDRFSLSKYLAEWVPPLWNTCPVMPQTIAAAFTNRPSTTTQTASTISRQLETTVTFFSTSTIAKTRPTGSFPTPNPADNVTQRLQTYRIKSSLMAKRIALMPADVVLFRKRRQLETNDTSTRTPIFISGSNFNATVTIILLSVREKFSKELLNIYETAGFRFDQRADLQLLTVEPKFGSLTATSDARASINRRFDDSNAMQRFMTLSIDAMAKGGLFGEPFGLRQGEQLFFDVLELTPIEHLTFPAVTSPLPLKNGISEYFSKNCQILVLAILFI